MTDGSKTLDQQIEDARRVLGARLEKRRRLEDRGRYITASLVLRVADDDPVLARRIHEIVSRGVRNDRDRAAVGSMLERLDKVVRSEPSPADVTPPEGGRDPDGSSGPYGSG